MSFLLSEWTAKRYGLTNCLHIKTSSHLCWWCDLFFQQVKKLSFPTTYDSNVQRNRTPFVSEKLLAARDKITNCWYPHWDSLSGLTTAVEDGCHICRLFLSQLTEAERVQLAAVDQEESVYFLIRLKLRISFYDKSRPAEYRIDLTCRTRSEKPTDISSTFHDLRMASTQDENCVSETWIERDRWSSAVQTSQQWIQTCVTSHPLCISPLLKPSNWPRRLIAVGNDNKEVRLCKKFDRSPRYITLSHCWGSKGVPFKLTLENESSLCEQIPMDKLTSTFRDAIAFTRTLENLHVEYLWIDALCIIQNSEDDWQHEATIMGDIYGNGICNFAACTGSDGKAGLFPMNDAWFSHNCIITAGPASCLEGSFMIHNDQLLCDSEQELVREKSVTSRAWCLQELMLPKCVLYFARHQLIWDCRTIVAREQDPQCLLDDEVYDFPNKKHESHLAVQKYQEQCVQRGVEPSISMIYDQWLGVLMNYTRCNLTRHTDKLVAVSGLARKMHSVLGPNEEYVGGLWTRYLHLHLLWDALSNHSSFRFREYRAPSWSWASIEGGIYNHRLRDDDPDVARTSLIRANISHKMKTADPYGALSSAVLHIEGPLLKVSLGPRASSAAHIVASMTTRSGLRLRSGLDLFNMDLDFHYPGNDPIDAHCLLVVHEVSEGNPQLAGLVLVRQDGIKGQFIRIGLAFVLPIGLLGEARSQRLPVDDYEFSMANGDYKISVI